MSHSIGKTIAELRTQRGFTQAQLGRILNVSDKAVSKWEREQCLPDLSVISHLADVLEVSCDYLLTGTNYSIHLAQDLFSLKNAIDAIEHDCDKAAIAQINFAIRNLENLFTNKEEQLRKAVFDEKRDTDERLKLCDEYLSLKNISEDYYASVLALKEHLFRVKEMEEKGLLPYKLSFGAKAQPVTEKDGQLFLERTGFFVSGVPSVYLLCGPDHATWGKNAIPIYNTALKEVTVLSEEAHRTLPREQGPHLILIEKDVTVKTPAGTFEGCLVFQYRHGGMRYPVVQNFYCPGVGIVKCAYYLKEDALSTRLEEYELTEYTLHNDEHDNHSLFPLQKGNCWCYRKAGAPKYFDSFYKREVLSVNIDEQGVKRAMISSADSLLFLENNADGAPAKELFDLGKRHSFLIPNAMRAILKDRTDPYYKQMARINLDFKNQTTAFQKRHTSFFAYLRKENLQDGRLIRLSPSENNLTFTWMVLPEKGLCHKELAALDLFSYAPLFDGRVFPAEWTDGYENNFKKEVLFENPLFMTPRDAYQVAKGARELPEKYPVTLHCTVKVSAASEVKLSDGRTFTDCLKVELLCSPEKEEVLYTEQTFFIGQLSPAVLCGKRTLFFAPGVGIVRAETDDNCGTAAVVELSSSPAICDSSYMPLYFGCENRYQLLDFDPAYLVEWGYQVCLGKDDNHDHLMSTFQLGEKRY